VSTSKITTEGWWIVIAWFSRITNQKLK